VTEAVVLGPFAVVGLKGALHALLLGSPDRVLSLPSVRRSGPSFPGVSPRRPGKGQGQVKTGVAESCPQNVDRAVDSATATGGMTR
jgi:hypothetical protein